MRALICCLMVGLVAAPVTAAGRLLVGDSVRDRGRGGASVASERGTASLLSNPALLGLADGFATGLGWTTTADRSEFKRLGPFVADLETQGALEGRMQNGFPASQGISTSRWSGQLLSLGLAYGFGTEAFRMGFGFNELPVQNHVYSEASPARYRLIKSDDSAQRITLGFAGHVNKRFAYGLGLHWTRIRRARRLMINASPVDEGNPFYTEPSGQDYRVDAAGTFWAGPDFSPDNGLVPTPSIGLWARLFAGLEFGLSVTLGTLGTAAAGDATVDATPVNTRAVDDTSSPLFARRGSPGNAANMTDGLPMIIRAGLRYDFKRWDLEFEYRLEQWEALDAFSVTAANNGVAYVNQPDVDGAEGFDGLDFGDDGMRGANATSMHLGADYWMVPRGLALRFGLSREGPAGTDSDAAVYNPQVRYGIGAGMSIVDRGFVIDVGYYHVFSESEELPTGSLTLRNADAGLNDADAEALPIQNSGSHTFSQGFFGLGVRADLDDFVKQRNAQREAWYRVWTKGLDSFESHEF
jgi:hypothetical protein